MKYKKSNRSPWLIFAALIVIMSLLWFFSDLKNTEELQVITEVERKVGEPLSETILVESLDLLNNRLTISDSELSLAQLYMSSKTSNAKNQSAPQQ